MGRLEPGQGSSKQRCTHESKCNACKAMDETDLVTQAAFAEIYDEVWTPDDTEELVRFETEQADLTSADEKGVSWGAEQFLEQVSSQQFMIDTWKQFKAKGN